MELGSQRERER